MASLIPKSTLQVRPRIAVELRPEGVYAARAGDAAGLLAQVAGVPLPLGALLPSLRNGNIFDRDAIVAALKHALGQVALPRQRDVTLILPDTAVRVLLLDFDELPSSVEEALPVLRFRLARLLPFNPEHAQVSYQVMSRHSRLLQVLAVAIPNDVLAEYESVVRDAGYEPGAVLPSTLAVCAGIDDVAHTASLLINGSEHSVTTAILRRGEVLLHRTLDLKIQPMLEAIVTTDEVEIDAGGVAVAELIAIAPPTVQQESERTALELLQAISVAAAYYEDSLAIAPEHVVTAGTLSADALAAMLVDTGLTARDAFQSTDMLATAVTHIPRGLLAGLRGALKI